MVNPSSNVISNMVGSSTSELQREILVGWSGIWSEKIEQESESEGGTERGREEE